MLPSDCCFTVGTHREKSLAAAARNDLKPQGPTSLVPIQPYSLLQVSEIRLGSYKHLGRKQGAPNQRELA